MNVASSKKSYKSKKKTVIKNTKYNTYKSSVKTVHNNSSTTSSTALTTKNKALKLVLFLALIFIIGILLTIFVYNKINLLQYREIDLSVKIENGSSSFNTSTDGLNFARMYPGGEVTKRIDIHSLKRSLVHIEADGTIADFITFSENNFVMEPGEYRQVEVYLTLPFDALEGPYHGKLKIYFYRK
jgi:hypothetical protein